MSRVFINYRKGEHTLAVEALHHQLTCHFGEDEVFLDMQSIPLGDRYPDVLRKRVAACEVLLVVIHTTWLTAASRDGERLIDRPDDWVRKEIEIGLAAGRQIIPVLLGGAGVPDTHELPESIRDMPIRQAHRIRQGYFRNDIDQLISKMEYHVAPTWTPPVPVSPRPRRISVKWLARPVVSLSATLLALPPVLTLTYVDPYDHDLLFPTFYFLYVSTLLTIALLISRMPYMLRQKSVDREIQSWSTERFNRFSTPVIMLFLLFGVTLTVGLNADDWRFALPLMLGLSVAFFARMQFVMMRREQREENELANWPQPLPSSLRDGGFPADLRRTMDQLRTRVAEWRKPLSREQRDKLRWVLAQLAQIVDRLRACARRSRWRWLIEDHPWAASVYAVLMATTLGLVMALLAPPALDGHLKPEVFLTVAKFPLVMGVAGVGILEITYRYKRWLRELLAGEIDNNLAELGKQLPQTAAAFADGDEARANRSPNASQEPSSASKILNSSSSVADP